MRILDLFCGAGGAARGLHDACLASGVPVEITGIDCEPQPRYAYIFIRMDVTKMQVSDVRDYDFIWASPPCQAYSAMTKRWPGRPETHADLIPFTRSLLQSSGKPYIIENVEGAPLLHPVMLCGSMFGLQTKHGSQLRRHRLFECSFPVPQPPCNHNTGSCIGVYGGGQHPGRRIPATIGVYGNAGSSSNQDNIISFSTQDRKDAMGIQWVGGKALSQAVPPAYSKYLLTHYLNPQGESNAST
jgi:DNA (cytosine-5)-methyltransferase 1